MSFWFRDIGYPEHRPALPGPRNADVAIVGAGLSGLWSAYYLKQARPDWDICIIEKISLDLAHRAAMVAGLVANQPENSGIMQKLMVLKLQ